MGNLFSRVLGRLMKKEELLVVMIGLDGAGKTTILYRLKLGKSVSTIPTVGFNVESVTYRNIRFKIWDVGGQQGIRPLWRHHYIGLKYLAFVVDSADRERLEEARLELHRATNTPMMRDCAVLIYANKQDLPEAVSLTELGNSLDLGSISQPHYVQATCAKDGKGLLSGLSWLSENTRSRTASK